MAESTHSGSTSSSNNDASVKRLERPSTGGKERKLSSSQLELNRCLETDNINSEPLLKRMELLFYLLSFFLSSPLSFNLLIHVHTCVFDIFICSFLFPLLYSEYSCAWHRDGSLLIQGHLYITANYVCFYSSILGWETKVRNCGTRR